MRKNIVEIKKNYSKCPKCGGTIYKCPVCERWFPLEETEVHHIDGMGYNNSSKNLIRLCRRCHRRIHGIFRYPPLPPFEEQKRMVKLCW